MLSNITDKLRQKARDVKLLTICDKAFEYAFDNYIFYYDSIDSYYSRKSPSLRRKIMFFWVFFLLFVEIVKCIYVSLYPDEIFWLPIKDALMVFGKQANSVYALLLCLGMVTFFGKLIMVFYEAKSQIKVFDIMRYWKARNPNYIIRYDHDRALTIKAILLYYVYLKFMGNIAFVFILFGAFAVTIGAYLYFDYGNVILLCLWTLAFSFVMRQMILVVLIASFFFYIPISGLNYKMDELTDSLRVNIEFNNYKGIVSNLKNYNLLVTTVKDLSGPYNAIIGLIYGLVPYMTAVCLPIVKINNVNDEIMVRLLKIAAILCFLFSNVNPFLINQISASITVRHTSLTRYLYPIFCVRIDETIPNTISNRRNAKLRIKLKIDSFIDRLNNQFVGFYCFNLFKFTKMSFFEYFLLIFSSYCLISKFLN